MIDVQEIRSSYPRPTVVKPRNRDDGKGYCVGGGIVQFVKNTKNPTRFDRFPRDKDLCDALCVIGLQRGVAFRLARKIITANDEGDFSGAWRLARQALALQRT